MKQYRVIIHLIKAPGEAWLPGDEVDESELKAAGANIAACIEKGLIELIKPAKKAEVLDDGKI